MTREEFKAKVSMALGSMERETWEDFLEAVWQLHLVASNQWIPVEEELPPPHYEGANSTDFVLVFDGYDVMFGYYDFGQKNWHGEDYKEMMFDITHWMPIVPPRKEE